MLYLGATTDIIDLVTSTAANTDVVCEYVDAVKSTLVPSNGDRQATNIAGAGTNTIVASPGASTLRTVKQLTIRNKDASLACDYTIRLTVSGPASYERHKVTLQPGWMLIYIEGIGFFVNVPLLMRSGIKNSAVADSASLTAASANYIAGSSILLPPSSLLPAGTVLRWRMHSSKDTTAGTGTSALGVSFGTAGTTADSIKTTVTYDTETAVADEAWDEVNCTIRGPITSSCIAQSSYMRNNNLSTTGLSNTARKAQVKRNTSGTFDITTAGLIAGLQLTPGAADVITIHSVTAELLIPNY